MDCLLWGIGAVVRSRGMFVVGSGVLSAVCGELLDVGFGSVSDVRSGTLPVVSVVDCLLLVWWFVCC